MATLTDTRRGILPKIQAPPEWVIELVPQAHRVLGLMDYAVLWGDFGISSPTISVLRRKRPAPFGGTFVGFTITNVWFFGSEKLYVYLSPYYRTRQTLHYIKENVEANVVRAIEDPRLREQDWGHLRHPDISEEIIRERDNFSPFYYRIPDGESGADVYDRVSTFLETLHRDFNKLDYPPNALIVTHGMTLRLFLMRWFHWSVEEFENLHNPRNGQIIVMQQAANGHYALAGELAKRK